MIVSRRRLFPLATAALARCHGMSQAAVRRFAGIRIGVTDWDLRQTGKVAALPLARKIGFAGVEVSLGGAAANGRLALADAGLRAHYLEAARENGIAIAGTCLDILHVNCMKNEQLGAKWVAEGIPATASLKARTMLLPFFGKCSAVSADEKDYVTGVLRELAPEAEKAKVVLCLENMLSAEDNARILDGVRSRALRIYYDVGNATNAGFDPPREIRWLGKRRIGQIHLKDSGYLGEGKIDFPAVLKAIDEIGYEGFLVLETPSPSRNVEADMKRNLAYVRKLMA